jgi:hypothetical protein
MGRPPSAPGRSARGIALAGIAVIAALATPALAQQTQRFTLSGARIEIYSVLGHATLHRAPGSAVVVQATRVGSDAAQLAFQTDENGKDGATRFRVVYPADRLGDGLFWSAGGGTSGLRLRDDGTFGGDDDRATGRGGRTTISSRGGFHGSADLDIAVPEGRTVRLHLAVGRVELNGTSGDFTIDTWGADVGARDIAGTYLFDTGSGDVTVRGASGSLRLDTGSGNCTVSGVRGTLLDIDTGSGDADATDVQVDRARFDTGSGNVKAHGLQARSGLVDTGSGDAELAFTGGALDDWRIDTGSGDATLALPPQAGVTISIDTGSGDLNVERQGLTLQRRQHDTTILQAGDGRGRMRIDTGSGGVTIR